MVDDRLYESLKDSARRYKSFETVEYNCDIIRLCREAYHPQHNGPSIKQMRNLALLCEQTVDLMGRDETVIQKQLEAIESRRTAKRLGEEEEKDATYRGNEEETVRNAEGE